MEKSTIEQRMHALLQACRDAGAKMTPQRMEIFREVVQSEEHPDAEMIYQRVRKRLPTVSLDTVYRTLWWLAGLGLVATIGPARERTRFDANLTRHHHFVCIRCGLTRDFYSRDLDNLKLPESVAAIGSIERTQVEVKGVCHVCAGKQETGVSPSQGESGQV
ncbi:MAG: transcriptional repressor [Desulfocurvibacter africanus]